MHITLSGYYGFDNAGDEALLSAITSSINRLDENADFTILSGAPDKTQTQHNRSAVYYLNPFKIIKTIKNTDLLISGGGSIFQDITSGRSLPYYICVVMLARYYDKPVIFYAQGVGPINRGFSRFLMRLVGNHATMITLRDKDSMDYLHSIGVNQPPMQVTADPVFALQPADEDITDMRRLLAGKNPGGRPLIGVALRDWPALDGYQEQLAVLLDEYYSQGYGILFIPMSYPDDIKTGAGVAELMQSPSVMLDDALSCRRLLAVIGECTLLIGMRLHALIFAANRGIPFAGISYDPKVASFLHMFEQEPLPATTDGMRAYITPLLNREKSQDELTNQARTLQVQADENARLALSLITPMAESNETVAAPENGNVPDVRDDAILSAEANRATGRNFIWVSLAIFFSKLLGFSREIVIAATLGTTKIADAFHAIFGLPNLLFTGIGNALMAVNIPDLTKLLRENKAEERKAYVANFMTQISLFCGLLSILGVVLAPWITRFIAPGLETQAMDIAIMLCRIMIPCLLFVNLAYFSMGILQTHGFFILSSLISIPFNILIILSMVFFGDDVIMIGYMTTAGWFLQFFIQYPRMRKLGYRLFGRISFLSPQAKNLYRNLLPILLGYSVLQICLLIDRNFGTRLDEGTASALAAGSNLFLTITSVFVVAMSYVIFPRLSKFCQERDYAKIRHLIGTVFQILFFVLLPYMLLIIFFHREIIMIVYERGVFTSESTYITATAFLFYSFASVGYACQEIFNRVFYAFKKYRVPMYTSVFCILLNIVLNFFLFARHGIAGISLSTAFCMLLYAVILYLFLRREIGGMGLSLLFGLAKSALPLLVMLCVILAGRYFGGDSIIVTLGVMAAGGLAYLGVALYMGAAKLFAR